MSDYKEARDFYDAFIGRTWNYSTDVRMGVAGTADEEWSLVCANTEPSKIKNRFISGLNECADLLEKEGGYQGRKTANAIREILDELSSIYLDNDDLDNNVENDDEFVIKNSKDCDIALAGQFVAESTTGGIDYKPTTSYADTELRAFQEQYTRYCMMAKANIAKDSIDPRHVDPMMKMFKKYVIDYISDRNNKKHSGMKYLYDLDKDDLIIHQISMFSYMANMKNVKDIDNITRSELHSALNPESVALAIGLYTYLTIIVNKNYTANDFNKLFVESWVDYYNNVQARYVMLRMNGNNWKDEFKGALLSD